MEAKLINRGTEGELLLVGRLDTNSANEMAKIFEMMAQRFDAVILNLSQMDYTASSGLRLILNLQKAMDRKGGDLKIRGARPTVMEVFEMTGFASFLTFIT